MSVTDRHDCRSNGTMRDYVMLLMPVNFAARDAADSYLINEN